MVPAWEPENFTPNSIELGSLTEMVPGVRPLKRLTVEEAVTVTATLTVAPILRLSSIARALIVTLPATAGDQL
jgi:hypothetical protein